MNPPTDTFYNLRLLTPGDLRWHGDESWGPASAFTLGLFITNTWRFFSSHCSGRLISSFFFLSHGTEILLSALMMINKKKIKKNLKRRQLPPHALMCSRNNCSQSRAELQSVFESPQRRKGRQICRNKQKRSVWQMSWFVFTDAVNNEAAKIVCVRFYQ